MKVKRRPSCFRFVAGFALAALFGAGCGDGAAAPDPPGPGGRLPPGELTDARRGAALAAVETRLAELDGADLPDAAVNDSLRRWLLARAEFEAAGVDESSSVWARFTDGRLLIIANNREPGPPAGAEARADARSALPAVQPAAAGAGNAQLPVPIRARLLHSFGAGFEQVQEPVRDLAGWLAAAGYDVVQGGEGDARVDVLRQVSGDGFFYFNTHGGKGRTRQGQDVFAVQTSSLVTPSTDNLADFRDDLDSGRLVYMTAKNGGKILGGLVDDWDTRYAITHLFVDRYMSFGENSVVFFNVCFGANEHADVSSFVFAAHKKGAGLYVGWSRSVSSTAAFTAVRYFVDRLLGANRYRPEDPHQRPFDAAAVLEEMGREGLTTDASTGAQLVARPAVAGSASLLRPSIYALEPGADGADEVTIHGLFGSDPGEAGRAVTVAGVPVAVQEWTPERITVAVPRAGAGSSGDVVVTVRGRKSNARALVAWRGRMTFTLRSVGTLTQRMEFDLHLRGDPDRARQGPGEAPADLPREFSIQAIPDATGSYSVSGSYAWAVAGDPCPHTEHWGGSGTLVYGPNQAGHHGMLYGGWVRGGDTRTLELGLVAHGEMTLRMRLGDPCHSDTTSPIAFTLARELFGNSATIPLALDGSFNILPGRIEANVVGPFAEHRTSTATLEWDAIPAHPASAGNQQK